MPRHQKLSFDYAHRLIKELRDKIDAKNAEIAYLKQEIRITKELYEEIKSERISEYVINKEARRAKRRKAV